MASTGQVESWTDEAICPICLEFFTDPVSLECGHNFCRSCITRCWEREERNICPECRAQFADRNLRPSWLLKRLADKARKVQLKSRPSERKLHCKKHEEELKLFCETDKKLICLICRDAREHKEHRFLPIEEAFEVYKDQVKSSFELLTKRKSVIKGVAKQQKQKIERVREQSNSLQSEIKSQFAELHQILIKKEQNLLQDLRSEEARIRNPMEKNLRVIQEKLNSIRKEISLLKKQLDQKDCVKFLKEEAQQKRRLCDEEKSLPVTDGALPIEKFNYLFLLKNILGESLNAINQVSVTLDVETAHPLLEVSEDRKSVRRTGTRRNLPVTGKRFTAWICVLGSEGFTSGKHYWEVEVTGNRYWGLGVAAESVERKGQVRLIPETGFWTIRQDDHVIRILTFPESRLPAGPIPRRVGVYLNYESGTVSFYNAETKSHLHTISRNKFTGKLHPFFWTGDENQWLRICSSSAPGLYLSRGPFALALQTPDRGLPLTLGNSHSPGNSRRSSSLTDRLRELEISVESLTEEVICPICLDFFTDPVSLECGHYFCHSCITRCWEREERNSCPECREEFADSSLRASRALANLSEKARKLNLNPKGKESKLHCEKHEEELKLFCETDKTLICLICATAREHKSHNFMPVNEAVEIYKDQIKSSLDSHTKRKSDFEEMEQQQKEKISEVQEQSHSLQTQIISQFAELHQILTEKEQRILRDLREEEERILNPMEKNLREIQENLNSIQEEISKLQERMDQQDSVIFLLEEARRKRRISDDTQTLSVTDGALLVEKFDHPYFFNIALEEPFDSIKRVSVTLDEETANPWLDMSEDRKSMRCSETRRDLPDTGKMFTYWLCALGSVGFTSGRYYWEVEVEGNQGWCLGVAAESVDRKGGDRASPETGFWIVERDDHGNNAFTSAKSCLTASPIPGRVGVYLSYESGTVSFYNAETKSHLHTFTGNKFTEKLYPFFWTWDENQWLRICSGSALVAGITMASKGQVESWTEEAICPNCLDFFTDPVILECGHNFCRSCVTQCWEREERNSCPECREVFADRTLRASRILANLSEKARKLNLNPKEKENKLHCEKHEEELKLFCETDGKLICVICRDALEHKSHNFLPIEEAIEVYKDRVKSSLDSLTKRKSDLEKMEKEQKEKISGVREQSHILQSHVKLQTVELQQILTKEGQHKLRDLREEEERILNPMDRNLRKIQENLNSIQDEISRLQEQMDQKESVIFLKEAARRKRRISDDHELLSVTDGALPVEKFDHPYLLTTTLRETLDSINRVSVTLDVEMAHPQLEVSEDRKSVRRTGARRNLPDTGKRFTAWPCVLGSEGFTSGRHYWEVEVTGNRWWDLGVAAESVERKGGVAQSPETGFWTIRRVDHVMWVLTSPESRLPAVPIPERVGVYLSYESGTVSFYNAETKSHLHTFTGNKFTGKLYPFFRIGYEYQWLRICSSSAPGDEGSEGDEEGEGDEDLEVGGIVLGSEGFASGRHYWEVEVTGNQNWSLGVAAESMERNRWVRPSPETGFWIIQQDDDKMKAYTSPLSRLSADPTPGRVGVYLSYESGTVSFYNAETKSHLHTFTGNKFTEKLYPFFATWDENQWLRICSGSTLGL
ncbi:uncharacterized protein [Hemitrygon akajei]|uniref:uncharacterized protein n=1 Tax=Hemitrygon akajei TaxID=2704970 RepID=UPI003BF9E543